MQYLLTRQSYNMPDTPVSARYKEYANNIVGTWYNRIPDEILIFSFLEDLEEEAVLQTQHNGMINKAMYNLTISFDNQWYLQIWSDYGKKNGVYRIEILTTSILTVSTTENKTTENKITTYHRKVDYAFANQLLEEMAE